MIRLGMFLGDRYEILEKIGSGGMADVFKGKDHKLNRLVAVKVLKDEFVEDKNFVRKFKEEAQAAAALAHPNIVNVYDVGDEQNINYIVMELVEGITLKNYIEKKGRLTIKEATSIAIQVSAGLEIAHNNHIIHRDIKPQNIIISKDGKVKVTDFGIAKSVSSHTNTADAMGSVHYTSPEQARGGYSDAKSDIYSLGIVLYEMVTGRVPFDGDTTVVVAVKHLQEEMVSPCVYASNVPVSLEQIILKCTEKSPDRRYANIADLMADLKQSLITPDDDFVVRVMADGAKTVAISRDDLQQIKRETGRVAVSSSYFQEEDEDDPFADMDDDDEYEDDDEDDDDIEIEEDEDDDEGGLDPRLEKVMTIGGIVAAVIIFIIIIVIIFKLFGFGGKNDSDPIDDDIFLQDVLEDEDMVPVPDLIGMSYSEAKEALNSIGLGIDFGQTIESDEYEEGQILGQSEDPDTMVEKNTTIVVDICGGSESIDIPDVAGKTQTEAQSQLKAAGFESEVIEEFSDSVAQGRVISTRPNIGTKAQKGSVITIVLSKGPEEILAIVPNIVGDTESAAKQKLASAKLSVGKVTQDFSDTVPEGYVISQTVKANSEVKEGTAVGYVVSKGPKEEEIYIGIDAAAGNSEESVVAYLKGKGLNVSVTYEDSETVAKGTVISCNPGNGSWVKPGSTVHVVVSRGPSTSDPSPDPE